MEEPNESPGSPSQRRRYSAHCIAPGFYFYADNVYIDLANSFRPAWRFMLLCSTLFDMFYCRVFYVFPVVYCVSSRMYCLQLMCQVNLKFESGWNEVG